MKDATEEKEPKVKREKAPLPSKVGESDKAGYTIVAIKEDRFLIKTPGNKFGVYTKPWVKDEEKPILRPVKDEAVARSVLDTGKVPETPKKEKAPKQKGKE